LQFRLAGQKGSDATASRPPEQRYSKLHFIPEFAEFINETEMIEVSLTMFKHLSFIEYELFSLLNQYRGSTADFVDLNAWLAQRCRELAQHPHPDQPSRMIADCFLPKNARC